MNPSDLLSELQARHVEVMVVGDRLRIRPAEVLPPGLRAELRARQSEVVELLRARGERCLAEALPGGVSEARDSVLTAEPLTMWLPDFARARLVVEVRSDLLAYSDESERLFRSKPIACSDLIPIAGRSEATLAFSSVVVFALGLRVLPS